MMTDHERNIRVQLEHKGTGGVLQNLGEDILVREKDWQFVAHSGIKPGTTQTTKGRVDIWFRDKNDSYVAVQPSSEKSKKKLMDDTLKGINSLIEVNNLFSTTGGKVVLLCSKEPSLINIGYCKNLCDKHGFDFEVINNSEISKMLFKNKNHDILKKILDYEIVSKRPLLTIKPEHEEIGGYFDCKFILINNGDDYISFVNADFTRYYSENKEALELKDVDLNISSIAADGGKEKVDLYEQFTPYFIGSVKDISKDYIEIVVKYKGSSSNTYIQKFKYKYLNSSGQWRKVTINEINLIQD
jgi:hypothetical protein